LTELDAPIYEVIVDANGEDELQVACLPLQPVTSIWISCGETVTQSDR